MDALLIGIIDLRYSRMLYKQNKCDYNLLKNIVTSKDIQQVLLNSYDNYNPNDDYVTQSNKDNNIFILKDVSSDLMYYMYSSVGSTTNVILQNMCAMHKLSIFPTTNLRKSMTIDFYQMICNDFANERHFNKLFISFKGDLKVGTIRYDGPLGSNFRQQIGIITSPKLDARDYPGYII